MLGYIRLHLADQLPPFLVALSAGINSHQAKICFPQFCTAPCQSFTRNSGTNTASELERIERLVFGFFVRGELECGFHLEFKELLAVVSVLEVKSGNSCPVFEQQRDFVPKHLHCFSQLQLLLECYKAEIAAAQTEPLHSAHLSWSNWRHPELMVLLVRLVHCRLRWNSSKC
ncbi:hypothetical protein Drorol1_Dr00017536 [Drosera rotundifolia]